MTKKEQRELAKLRISEITDKDKASVDICGRLFADEKFFSARNVLLYLSTENEVRTDSVVKHCFMLGKRVFVLTADDDPKMLELFESDEFVIQKYGIREPKVRRFINDKIDVALIPMVAFDRDKNRLGHGKGCYDRFLSQNAVYKIGLAFSGQEQRKITTEKSDVVMDEIITEKETLR